MVHNNTNNIYEPSTAKSHDSGVNNEASTTCKCVAALGNDISPEISSLRL